MRRNEVEFASPASKAAAERLGRSIRLARLARNLTQSDFAERARIGRRTLTRIERGDSSVSFTGWLSALESASLLPVLERVADPNADALGQAQRSSEVRKRARKPHPSASDKYDF